MKKINSFLLIFTFFSSIFAANLNSMKRQTPDNPEVIETTEETNRYLKQPRRFLHGLRTFRKKQNPDQANHFDELPDEVLAKIFVDSNNSENALFKVCKRFYGIRSNQTFIRLKIRKYKKLLNSVINFDSSTNTLNLTYINSDDRVKALLGFKFLIQLRTKSLFLKTLGINAQTFCIEQYNALLRFFENFNDYLKNLRIDEELKPSNLEKSILGIDAPYNVNLVSIYTYLTINLKQRNNILINVNNLACGETPLIIASKLYSINGVNIDLIKMLLALGADINLKSTTQNTPLHFALKNKLSEPAVLFLESNANFRIKNNIGETALELIARLNNPEIDKVLIPKLTWYEKQLFNFARFFKTRIR